MILYLFSTYILSMIDLGYNVPCGNLSYLSLSLKLSDRKRKKKEVPKTPKLDTKVKNEARKLKNFTVKVGFPGLSFKKFVLSFWILGITLILMMGIARLKLILSKTASYSRVSWLSWFPRLSKQGRSLKKGRISLFRENLLRCSQFLFSLLVLLT